MSYFFEQLRHERYDEIHISPHMDDSAYSCAGRILQRRREGARVLVVTVFGNGKQQLDSSDKGTFSDYIKRLEEERAVMQRMDVDHVWLNYPELLFRKNDAGSVMRFLFPFMGLSGSVHDELFETLLALIGQRLSPGGEVWFPFGVGFHPDHRVLFDVGRAVHGLGRFRVTFYEDVPYATVPALRALRLAYLGAPASFGLWRATRDLNVFLFRNFGVWRALTWLPILIYLCLLIALHALMRTLDRKPDEPLPQLTVREIGDVIAEKADVMRLYPSQTAFFMTLGPELVEMIKFEGRSQELSWRFPPFPTPPSRLSPRQRRTSETQPTPVDSSPGALV
ncbi:MAG TPA: PIG-L family deacetylase [Polyangiales bacterium]